MNSDNCLQSFYKFNYSNSWIYSLFIAFFYSEKPNPLIKDFVDNLKDIDPNTNKYIEIIQTIYSNILQKEYSIDLINRLITIVNSTKLDSLYVENEFGENGERDPNDLLKYLLNNVFDTVSYEKISLYSITNDDYVRNELKKYEKIEFKNINFINIHTFNSNIVLKDTIDELFLYSIIAYIGDYYVCYYKCNDIWYLYNSRGIDDDINVLTIKIGNLEEVINNYYQIIKKIKDNWDKEIQQLVSALPFKKLEDKKLYDKYEQKIKKLKKKFIYTNYNLTLLYLKNKTNKIKQLKELVDNHFDRLNIL
jgi:hypothetical protein